MAVGRLRLQAPVVQASQRRWLGDGVGVVEADPNNHSSTSSTSRTSSYSSAEVPWHCLRLVGCEPCEEITAIDLYIHAHVHSCGDKVSRRNRAGSWIYFFNHHHPWHRSSRPSLHTSVATRLARNSCAEEGRQRRLLTHTRRRGARCNTRERRRHSDRVPWPSAVEIENSNATPHMRALPGVV